MRKILFVALCLICVAATARPIHAQLKKPAVTGNIVNDIKTDLNNNPATTTASQSGNILNQLRAKFTKDVSDDLNSALTLAQQVPAGCATTPPTVTACTQADTTAIPCYQALIALNGVINSYTPPADKPHVISDLEQLRIVARTVQSTNFKDACAPLVQDIQSQANQLVASVLGIVAGSAKIGLAIP